MDDVHLIRTLEKDQLTVFTTQQLAATLEMKPSSATVRLNRLVKKGVLQRVIRNRYIVPSADILSLASNLYIPSYVSLLAAFAHHKTTTQTPRIIDVINPKISITHKISIEEGLYVLRFIKVRPTSIYGFTKTLIGGKTSFIADKEKAIIDSLMHLKYISLDEVKTCIQDGIDYNKAIDYAIRTQRQSVMKRLGYLLSTNQIPCDPSMFPQLSPTYIRLDPQLSRRGVYNNQWHIIVNRVIE